MHMAKANPSSIIPYWKQYMPKIAMMVDKPSEVGLPISCSPLVNASLGPIPTATHTVPCPSCDFFLELFFAFANFTFYENKTESSSRLRASPPHLHFLAVPRGAAPLDLSLFQVTGLRVIISSLKECTTQQESNKFAMQVSTDREIHRLLLW